MTALDDTMAEFKPWFDRLGFTRADAFRLIGSATAAGTPDPDMPAEAVRELALRVLDGAPVTDRALARLGLAPELVWQGIAAEGAPARAAVAATLKALRKVHDVVERRALAADLFGAVTKRFGADGLLMMEVR